MKHYPLCKKCANECKASGLGDLVYCPKYVKLEKTSEKSLKNAPVDAQDAPEREILC